MSEASEKLFAARKYRRMLVVALVGLLGAVVYGVLSAPDQGQEIDFKKLEQAHLEVIDESYNKTPEPSVADDGCPYGHQRLDFEEVAAATLHRIKSVDSGSETFPDFDKYAFSYVKAYRKQRDLPTECLTVNWRRQYISPLDVRVRQKLAELEALASNKERLRKRAEDS